MPGDIPIGVVVSCCQGLHQIGQALLRGAVLGCKQLNRLARPF